MPCNILINNGFNVFVNRILMRAHPSLREDSIFHRKRFALNLFHLTLPEIRDFNALSDALCIKLNAKRYRPFIQYWTLCGPL